MPKKALASAAHVHVSAGRASNMIDVFVSYSHRDREFAAALVAALARTGLRVWWDALIEDDAPWDREIQAKLTEAASVVVLWSRSAVTSGAVLDEASFARMFQKVHDVLIDDCEIPPFESGNEPADLRCWVGEQDHAELQELVATLANRSRSVLEATAERATRKIRHTASFAGESALDQTLSWLQSGSVRDMMALDLSGVQFIGTHSMVGLMVIGDWIRASRGVKARLVLPTGGKAHSFLSAMGFITEAASVYTVAGNVTKSRRSSYKSLLPLSCIRAGDDNRDRVLSEGVRECLGNLLTQQLGYEQRRATHLVLAIADTVRALRSGASTDVWFAASTANYRKRLGRKVIHLGFGKSSFSFIEWGLRRSEANASRILTEAQAPFRALFPRIGAPDAAVPNTEFADLRRCVEKCNGGLVLRSGQARLAIVPSWGSDYFVKREGLAFPGILISLTLVQEMPADSLRGPGRRRRLSAMGDSVDQSIEV